jgi:hypothetical protein
MSIPFGQVALTRSALLGSRVIQALVKTEFLFDKPALLRE